jgi:hypothetical protein
VQLSSRNTSTPVARSTLDKVLPNLFATKSVPDAGLAASLEFAAGSTSTGEQPTIIKAVQRALSFAFITILSLWSNRYGMQAPYSICPIHPKRIRGANGDCEKITTSMEPSLSLVVI